jgi:regulator of protease activity HflC (stomatin/prohibitin superfamily)
MKRIHPIKLLVLAALTLTFLGCGTVVPPGKKVIVLHASGESTSVDKGVYYCWGRDQAYFVDQKLKSFTENMQILCADDVNMDVDIKAVLSFEVDDASVEFIKQKVPATEIDTETKELSLEQFYEMTVKDIVRSSGRTVISQMKTDDIRPNRTQIEADVSQMARARLTELKYPLNVSAILLSNIDYPDVVTKQREEIKNAQLEDQRQAALAEAAMAEAQRRAGIETEEAKVRMIKAQGQADENKILAESLTPEYLRWRQLEVMEHVSTEMAKGQNNVVFIMPYEAISQDTMNTAMMRESISGISKEPRVVSEVVE